MRCVSSCHHEVMSSACASYGVLFASSTMLSSSLCAEQQELNTGVILECAGKSLLAEATSVPLVKLESAANTPCGPTSSWEAKTHEALSCAQAVAKDVPVAELERAKKAAISSVLMNLESRAVVAEDIGRQVLTYGHRCAARAPRQWFF